MEVLAIAASVAGLLSLAGQCIKGAQELYSVYSKSKRNSDTLDTFLKDVNGLLRTLYDVDTLLKMIDRASINLDNVSLVTLRLHLDECNSDLGSWISHSREYISMSTSWRRTKIEALVGSDMKDIQRRQMEVSVALTAVGAAFDVQLMVKSDRIENWATRNSEVAQAILAQSNLTREAVRRLELLTRSIARRNDVSPSRVREHTEAGQLRLSEPLRFQEFPAEIRASGLDRGDEPPLSRSFWSCSKLVRPIDVVRGKSSSFAPDVWRCFLCDWPGWRASSESKKLLDFSDHLHSFHKLGTCHLDERYFDLDQFRIHMEQIHYMQMMVNFDVIQHHFFVYRQPSEPEESSHLSALLEIQQETVKSLSNVDTTFPRDSGNVERGKPENHHKPIKEYLEFEKKFDFFDETQSNPVKNDVVGSETDEARSLTKRSVAMNNDSFSYTSQITRKSRLKAVSTDDGEAVDNISPQRHLDTGHKVSFLTLEGRKTKSEGNEHIIAPGHSTKIPVLSPRSDGVPCTPDCQLPIALISNTGEERNELWADSIESEPPSLLMSSSWDTELLSNWNGTTDRINRWMLHVLGSDESQANAHRLVFQDLTSASISDTSKIDQNWGRLVFKYWFLDEAACRPEIPAPIFKRVRDEVLQRPPPRPFGRRHGSRASSAQHSGGSGGSVESRRSIQSWASSVSTKVRGWFHRARSLSNNPPTGKTRDSEENGKWRRPPKESATDREVREWPKERDWEKDKERERDMDMDRGDDRETPRDRETQRDGETDFWTSPIRKKKKGKKERRRRKGEAEGEKEGE